MKTKYFILLATLMELTLACKPKDELNRYPLTEIDQQMLPYRLGDTVCFKDEKGNPVSFVVADEKIDWRQIELSLLYQYRTVILHVQQEELEDLQIRANVAGWFFGPDYYRSVDMSINRYETFSCGLCVYYDVIDGHFLNILFMTVWR